MANLSTSNIRNVVLIGHHAAGKTTLAEAMLAFTGAVTRQGSVDKGSTVCDFEPEETARKLSVSLALAPFEADGVRVNLLDAPGYPDFAFDMAAGLSVADLAVIVVSATDGVQAQTEDAWRAAADLGIPRVIVVNKLDRERSDFHRVLAEIRERFGAGVAPVELPIGVESAFCGVVDLLDSSATIYDTGTPPPVTGKEVPVPEDLVGEAEGIHEQLVEGIVVADDDLMTRYLEGETIPLPELHNALADGVTTGAVFPVLCCSATSGVGIDRLIRLLVELCPSPDARSGMSVFAGDDVQDVPFDAGASPLVYVAKTMSDAHAGKLSIAKVLSGTLRPDVVLMNTRTRSEERLHVLEHIRGRQTEAVTEAVAGDFVAIPRLAGTRTFDTLAPKTTPVSVISPGHEEASLPVAVRPVSRADDDKLMSALQRICEEDPGLGVRREDETHQTVLDVRGEVHLGVVLDRLARKFGVAVEREDVLIPYRETITKAAEAEARHKKQTGGHGQFAVVHLKVEPLPRGGGFEFHDRVVGGAIPRQYIPAVEKGVVEAMSQGGVVGHRVVDVSVTCDDGKHHPVDSSEMAFKTAAAMALRDAMREAGPVVLEPVSVARVTVPADLQGDVLGDLHSRRARIQGTEIEEDGRQTIVALVPTAELGHYAVDLRAITGGRGRYTAEHDHYDVAPSTVSVRS